MVLFITVLKRATKKPEDYKKSGKMALLSYHIVNVKKIKDLFSLTKTVILWSYFPNR